MAHCEVKGLPILARNLPRIPWRIRIGLARVGIRIRLNPGLDRHGPRRSRAREMPVRRAWRCGSPEGSTRALRAGQRAPA